MRKIKRGSAALAVAFALTAIGAGPAAAADGVPANDGCGRLFGSLVSAEARAGSLGGPDVGPASHQGLHGVKGALCGG